jgi:hypothetical protein
MKCDDDEMNDEMNFLLGRFERVRNPAVDVNTPLRQTLPPSPHSPANMGRNNILYSSTLPLSFLSGNDIIPHSF